MEQSKKKIVEFIQERHPTEEGVIVVRGKYEDGTISENVLNILTTSKEVFERYKAIPEPIETSYEKAKKRMLKPIVTKPGESLEELLNAL